MPEQAAAPGQVRSSARAQGLPLQNVPRGILLALLAFLLFTGMDTCIKLLSARYATLQIVAINAFLAASLPVLVILARGATGRLRTRAPGRHLLRGLLMLIGCALAFWAYGQLPLADAYAILFSMPLIITALAWPLLGERVGWRRWAAVLVGFVGVLVMLWPGGGGFHVAALAALAAAAVNGLATILVRVMRGESAESFVVYGNLTVAIGAACAFPWVWVTPALADLPLFLASGTAAGIAFLCLARAYQLAPAAVAAPFQYSQMLYAVAIGAALFGTLPDLRTVLGAALVAGSGLFVLYRETRAGVSRDRGEQPVAVERGNPTPRVALVSGQQPASGASRCP